MPNKYWRNLVEKAIVLNLGWIGSAYRIANW